MPFYKRFLSIKEGNVPRPRPDWSSNVQRIGIVSMYWTHLSRMRIFLRLYTQTSQMSDQVLAEGMKASCLFDNPGHSSILGLRKLCLHLHYCYKKMRIHCELSPNRFQRSLGKVSLCQKVGFSVLVEKKRIRWQLSVITGHLKDFELHNSMLTYYSKLGVNRRSKTSVLRLR